MAYGLLIARMYIGAIAYIMRYDHACVLRQVEQFTLTVPEPGPGRTLQAGELDIVEGQCWVVKIASPRLQQQLEETGVCIAVMGIALALIPHHSADGKFPQHPVTALEQITGFVGMTLQSVS